MPARDPAEYMRRRRAVQKLPGPDHPHLTGCKFCDTAIQRLPQTERDRILNATSKTKP